MVAKLFGTKRNMIKLFVSLKLRLLRNVLRTKGRWGLIMFSLLSLGIGCWLGSVVWSLDGPERFTAGPLLGGAMALGWMVGPLLFGASDETVDTSRLALFPLDSKPLAAGMAAASIVGPGPLAGFIPLAALAWQAPSLGYQFVGILAAVMAVALATTTSRLALTYLGSSLRNRRSRDIATVVAGLLAGAVGALFQLLNVFGVGLGQDQLGPIARVVRFTPLGWAGDAIGRLSTGELAIPLVELAATAALIVVVLRGWVDLLERALAEADSSDLRSEKDTSLVRERASSSANAASPNAVRVVLAKERRYLSRHPRYRVQLASQLTILVVGGAPFLNAVLERDPHAVLLGCIPGLTAGATGSNLLGPDGQALWAELLATPTFRPLIRGRSLLFVFMGIAASFVVTLAAALWTGGWLYAPVAMGCSVGMALVGSGIGSITSVLVPTPMSDDESANPFATTSPGVGCFNGLGTMIGVFVGLGFAAPILAGLAYTADQTRVGALLLVVAPLYGYAIWSVSTRLAARFAERHIPELVEVLATTR